MPPTRPRSQYKSSKGVLTGISFAHSTLFNARGLVFPWNAPYNQTFSELLQAYLNHSTALINSPYTIWAPGHKRDEEEVKEQLLELGLYYDDLPAKCSQRTLKKLAEKAHDAMQETKSVESLIEEISSLVTQRDNIVEQEAAWYRARCKRQEAPLNNFYDRTIDPEDVDTSQSFTRIPDIVITLVGSIEGPLPASSEQRKRSELCGGRKSYYERIAVMVELKRGGDRKSDYSSYLSSCGDYMHAAISQLAECCAAYFASMPDKRKARQDETKLVVIATGGQFWTWVYISSEDCPKWNYTESKADDCDFDQRKWKSLFVNPPLCLGTTPSDDALLEIESQHIFPLLRKIPNAPTYLKRALRERADDLIVYENDIGGEPEEDGSLEGSILEGI